MQSPSPSRGHARFPSVLLPSRGIPRAIRLKCLHPHASSVRAQKKGLIVHPTKACSCKGLRGQRVHRLHTQRSHWSPEEREAPVSPRIRGCVRTGTTHTSGSWAGRLGPGWGEAGESQLSSLLLSMHHAAPHCLDHHCPPGLLVLGLGGLLSKSDSACRAVLCCVVLARGSLPVECCVTSQEMPNISVPP